MGPKYVHRLCNSQLLTLKGHKGNVFSAVYSPDGKRVITASHDETARIWDAETGTEIAVLKGHTKSVHSAVFRSLAMASRCSPRHPDRGTARVSGDSGQWEGTCCSPRATRAMCIRRCSVRTASGRSPRPWMGRRGCGMDEQGTQSPLSGTNEQDDFGGIQSGRQVGAHQTLRGLDWFQGGDASVGCGRAEANLQFSKATWSR